MTPTEEELVNFIRAYFRNHYECEDNFYGCPKSEGYFGIPSSKCYCGKDKADELLRKFPLNGNDAADDGAEVFVIRREQEIAAEEGNAT
jgi:hypothetical protein